jgi:hypothetical protein
MIYAIVHFAIATMLCLVLARIMDLVLQLEVPECVHCVGV